MTPYDKAKTKRLERRDTLSGAPITLEPGVNFFVEALERAGAKVKFTCEGHPKGFSIVFDATNKLAWEIVACGYFNVELMTKRNRYHLSMNGSETGITHEAGQFTDEDKHGILRSASTAWTQAEWFKK